MDSTTQNIRFCMTMALMFFIAAELGTIKENDVFIYAGMIGFLFYGFLFIKNLFWGISGK